MKKKLLIVILFCIAIAGVASAREVINIDLNGYNDNRPYSGTAAYDDGINKWNAYSGGWGKPMGSPRSFALVTSAEPNRPGVYAAQVWIGDPGVDHTYKTGTGLMDDGFVNGPNAGDPNIQLFGSRTFGTYGGTYDIYVYGNAAGSFTLKRGSTVMGANSVTGGVPAGQFVLGGNYVVFSGVNIASDPNFVRIIYSNEINGLQLVSTKQPVAINSNRVRIIAGNYDVAGDLNPVGSDAAPRGTNLYGPEVFSDACVPGSRYVGYLDTGEFMEYDITVDVANQGRYAIVMDLNPQTHGTAGLRLYVDDVNIGYTSRDAALQSVGPTIPPLDVNLVAGTHTIKWVCAVDTAHPSTGENVYDVNLTRLVPSAVVIPDCNTVNGYALDYAGDLNKDCYVDTKDLDVITEQWLDCDDPQGCQ